MHPLAFSSFSRFVPGTAMILSLVMGMGMNVAASTGEPRRPASRAEFSTHASHTERVGQKTSGETGLRQFADEYLDATNRDRFVATTNAIANWTGWELIPAEDPGRPLLRALITLFLILQFLGL